MRLNQNTLTSHLYCMRLYNPSAFMTVVHGPSIYPNESRNVENFVLNPDPKGLGARLPFVRHLSTTNAFPCTGSSFTFAFCFSFMREPTAQPTARKQQVSQKGMYHKTTAVDFYISLNPTLYTPRIFTVPAYTAEEEKSTSVRPYQYQSRRCCHSPQQALVELNQMRSCKTRRPDRPQRTKTERSA